MHRLTIARAHRGATSSSEHPDAADAKRALAQYVEHANCRARSIQTHSDFSSWDLITLGADRVHATATIEPTRAAIPYDAEFGHLSISLDAARSHLHRAS